MVGSSSPQHSHHVLPHDHAGMEIPGGVQLMTCCVCHDSHCRFPHHRLNDYAPMRPSHTLHMSDSSADNDDSIRSDDDEYEECLEH